MARAAVEVAVLQAGLVGPLEGVTAEEERVEGTVEGTVEVKKAEDARAAEVKEAERAVEARVEEVTAPRRSPR